MRKLISTVSLGLLASFGAAQNTDVSSMPTNVGTKFTCSTSYLGGNPIVKAIGDINGDGISEIAVGFPYAGSTAALGTGPGVVAILYGGANLPNGLDVCAFKDTSVGFRIKGLASSQFGTSIVSMGDLNNDGSQDIAVSAPIYGGVGRVHVIYMPSKNGIQQEYSVSALSGYTLTSVSSGANFGTYMADPVDYNGDGLKDVLIASSAVDTNAYIFFGQTARSGDILTNTLTPFTGVTLSIPSTVTDTGFGQRAVASCQDFNQDTIPDYIIMGSANIFILYGNGSRPINEGVTVSNANGETIPLGSLSFGSTSNGNSVTCADLDMDGRQEAILSLSDHNVHVLYGSTIKGLSASTVDTKTFNQGFIITQVVGSSTFGSHLARTDGWNGYAQDVLLISEPTSSQVYALYASSGSFNASSGMISYVIDNMVVPQQGFKIWTKDGTLKLGSSIDATYDINGDGIKDLLVAEGTTYNSYGFYGQCQSATGCACPNNLKYKNGQCVNQGLSGGQKAGIIIGVILGAMLLIAFGVWVLKKTTCGAKCFDKLAHPVKKSHNPVPLDTVNSV